MVDDVLYSSSALEEGLAKEVAVEGNRIIAHLVFRLVDNEGIENPEFDWEKNLARVKPITTDVLHRLSALANLELSDRGSVRRLLNDVKKCQKLVKTFWVDFDTNPALSTEGDAPRVTLRGIREPEFRLQGRLGSDARGYRLGQGGFLVLRNSIAGDPAVPSLYPRYVKRRTQLIDESILTPTREGRHLLLKQDVTFDSPSDAGAVMTGCSVNGRQEWRTAEGVSLAQVEKVEKEVSESVDSANDEREGKGL